MPTNNARWYIWESPRWDAIVPYFGTLTAVPYPTAEHPVVVKQPPLPLFHRKLVRTLPESEIDVEGVLYAAKGPNTPYEALLRITKVHNVRMGHAWTATRFSEELKMAYDTPDIKHWKTAVWVSPKHCKIIGNVPMGVFA